MTSEKVSLQKAAKAVQQCLIRLETKPELRRETPSISAWFLSKDQHEQLVVTPGQIRQPKSPEEHMQIARPNHGLMFCNRHCFLPKDVSHLWGEEHLVGDFAIYPLLNTTAVDQMQILTGRSGSRLEHREAILITNFT